MWTDRLAKLSSDGYTYKDYRWIAQTIRTDTCVVGLREGSCMSRYECAGDQAREVQGTARHTACIETVFPSRLDAESQELSLVRVKGIKEAVLDDPILSSWFNSYRQAVGSLFTSGLASSSNEYTIYQTRYHTIPRVDLQLVLQTLDGKEEIVTIRQDVTVTLWDEYSDVRLFGQLSETQTTPHKSPQSQPLRRKPHRIRHRWLSRLSRTKRGENDRR
ncbi:hypothetical protein IAU60_003609 [Kwoniella sp. DSM 27419]